MTITAIILSHYKEREQNLKRIVDDLLSGTVKPDQIIIFIDNPEIKYEDDRCTIIKSSKSFLPIIRFAIGSICDTNYCFFIDDDLTVKSRTLENFISCSYSHAILGLEGNILANTDRPYTEGKSINRSNESQEVDIIIRTYFVPTNLLIFGLGLRLSYFGYSKESLDDIFLCLGNKINKGVNYVIPVSSETDVSELPEGGVGQSYRGNHYKNRDFACKLIKEYYG